LNLSGAVNWPKKGPFEGIIVHRGGLA
jgi:hypothetical protein